MIHYDRCSTAIIIAVLVCAVSASSLSSAFAQDQPVLAFLPLDNQKQTETLEHIQILPELIGHEIQSHVNLVDRREIEQVIEEQSLSIQQSMENRITAGELVGATHLLSGHYVIHGGELSVNLNLIDVETSQIEESWEVVGSPTDVISIGKRLSDKIRKQLVREPSDVDPNGSDPSPRTNLHYFRGLQYLYDGRFNRALGQFLTARQQGFSRPVLDYWLGRTYYELGDYAHSRADLETYLDRATDDQFTGAARDILNDIP